MTDAPLTHTVRSVDDALQWARWSRRMTGRVADAYQFRQAVLAARLLQAEVERLQAVLADARAMGPR